MRDDPADVLKAIRISEGTLSKIKQNLFWALGYNTAMIPLASLGLLQPVLAAIDDLGARPDQAVMIGDTAYDINAARAAGVRSIAVRYGYPRMPVEDLGADLIIDRFDELPAALETLAADPAYRRSG